MKTLLTFVFLTSCIYLGHSQNEADYSFYDYVDSQLSNTDSIPDYQSKEKKLKISGTIFQSDGITPAKDVILYIEQTDEDGTYDIKEKDEKRYVNHRGWVKTDADGRYTFYTFMPGTRHRSGQFKHIHPTVKMPEQAEYDLNAFMFDNDPLLTKSCRKRLKRKGLEDSILKVTDKDSILVANKDIILPASSL